MPASDVERQIVRQVLGIHQRAVALSSGVVIYLLALIFNFDRSEVLRTLFVLLPIYLATFGISLPIFWLHRLVRRALARHPGEPPAARLRRLMELPRRIDLEISAIAFVGVFGVLLAGCLWFGKPLWLLVPALLVEMLYSMLFGVWLTFEFEAVLRPMAIEQFHQVPELRLTSGGFLWRRQSWFLVYVFAVSLGACLLTALVVTGRSLASAVAAANAELLSTLDRERLTAALGSGGHLAGQLAAALAFAVGVSLLLARRLAVHERTGSDVLIGAVEGLARGKPILPDWISTDELGDFSFSLGIVWARLHDLGSGLRAAANGLEATSGSLHLTVQGQIQALDNQSALLAEAIHAAGQIRQATALAAGEARLVVLASTEADVLGRSGSAALAQAAGELGTIRAQVREMAQSARALEEQTREILSVTEVVKGLADQSNLLALNAAIEAVRAGHQGSGFAVVAHEIRSLADQSIEATGRVRVSLESLAEAGSVTAKLTEGGQLRVETSLTQLRDSGASLTQLLVFMHGTGESAKQIAAGVAQQTGGVNGIASAVKNLAAVMQSTLQELSAMARSQLRLATVVTEVRAAVDRYGLADATLGLDAPVDGVGGLRPAPQAPDVASVALTPSGDGG